MPVPWGETEYGVGILPLGGYVKMLGQDDNPANQARENERIRVRQPTAARSPRPTAARELRPATAAAPAAPAGRAPDASPRPGLDPRSFPAKPVWQRMIIISAGVMMNLVFAVVFAAVAYRAGVVYMPCILGGTSPGDPAWVGRSGARRQDRADRPRRPAGRATAVPARPDDQDRAQRAERDLELLVQRGGRAEPEWLSVRPTNRLKWYRAAATLGVTSAAAAQLDAEEPVAESFRGPAAYDQIQGGEEIVAINGAPLPRDPQLGVILGHHVDAAMVQHPAEPLKLRLARRPASAAGTARGRDAGGVRRGVAAAPAAACWD